MGRMVYILHPEGSAELATMPAYSFNFARRDPRACTGWGSWFSDMETVYYASACDVRDLEEADVIDPETVVDRLLEGIGAAEDMIDYLVEEQLVDTDDVQAIFRRVEERRKGYLDV